MQLPVRAAVEYWTGAAWALVSGLSDMQGAQVQGIGTDGSGAAHRNTVANRVRFDPVRTTRLRLVLAQNRSAVASTGVGISEWRVFSEDAESIVFSQIEFTDPHQWIFSNHVGNRAVPERFAAYDDAAAPADVLTAPSLDTGTGTVFLKLVNVEPHAKEIRVVLRGGSDVVRKASYVRIQSDDLLVRNQGSPDYTELVRPVTVELGAVRREVILEVPAQSVGALVLRPAN